MVQKRTKTGKVNQRSVATNSVIPDVYREMLAEELPLQCTSPSKPPKRRRIGDRIFAENSESFSNQKDDEQLEKFGKNNVVETVKKCDIKDTISIGAQDRGKLKYSSIQEITPTSGISESSCFSSDSKPQQTSYRDFDEESEISDCDWETIDIEHQNGILDSTSGKPVIEDLELTLTKTSATQEKLSSSRKKLLTKADRLSRSAVHKLHILCLISYLEKRNEWCNDDEVQISLEPLLTSKILNLLRPSSKLSQFSRTQSLKRGLEELSILWRAQFCITERGMRRALWTSNIENLKEVCNSMHIRD